MDITLDDLVKRIRDFDKDGPGRLEIKRSLSVWKELKNDYKTYSTKLRSIQAAHQHSVGSIESASGPKSDKRESQRKRDNVIVSKREKSK